ncbi:MAG: hypothetical protein ACK5T3_12960 [Betaproteobacteria bacterium]
MQTEQAAAAPVNHAQVFAHMVAHLRGVFVLPALRAPGRYVQPLELRRQAQQHAQEDEPE